MMTKEQIVLDFSVFVLFEIEELLSPITHFFEINQKDPFDFKILKYEEYIRGSIYINEILENNILKNDINSINDLLSFGEISELKDYLNKNFEEGFPDADRDGTYSNATPLEITISDLTKQFQNYLVYYRINKDVFITYYIQAFNSLIKSITEGLKSEVDKINSIKKAKELVDSNLSKEFVEHELKKYRRRLFKSIKNNNFQLKGLADDKGLYFDSDKTLLSYLEYLNMNVNNEFEYLNKTTSIKYSFDYLFFKYYQFSLKGIPIDTNINLNSLLNEFKKDNKSLIEFLTAKQFEPNEINIIINTLQNGIFNEMDIRYLPVIQVELFRFYYVFYIFDFYEENQNLNFESENDFIEILDLQKVFDVEKNILNQFLKYYKELNSVDTNAKHYPFRKAEKTIEKIEKILQIEKGKLKRLPNTKK